MSESAGVIELLLYIGVIVLLAVAALELPAWIYRDMVRQENARLRENRERMRQKRDMWLSRVPSLIREGRCDDDVTAAGEE